MIDGKWSGERRRLVDRETLLALTGETTPEVKESEDIFERQVRYIEEAAIPWAILNFLHAMPLTPLHARMKAEGRLMEDSSYSGDSTVSNFRTEIPRPVLVRGFQKTLASIYDPANFYERAWRSLQSWQSKDCQRPAQQPDRVSIIRILFRSIWHQGLRSSYRRAYWKYFFQLISRYLFNPPKLWLGFTLLISGNHFIPYTKEVLREVETQIPETVHLPALETPVPVE